MSYGTLIQAVGVAVRAHEGQTDKAGEPFIYHPLAVAEYVAWDGLDHLVVAAVLHDVVEDSDVTLKDLEDMGFDEETVTAVDSMTRRKGETYVEYIERLAENPAAIEIKLRDLEHNMDPTRGAFPGLMKRYKKAKKYLLERKEQ